MRTTLGKDTSATIELHTGQCFRVHASSKDCLLVQSGCIRLQENPDWLGYQFLGGSLTLTEGQAHLFDKRGWITIEALRSSSLLLAKEGAKHHQCNEQTSNWGRNTMASTLHRLHLWMRELKQKHITG